MVTIGRAYRLANENSDVDVLVLAIILTSYGAREDFAFDWTSAHHWSKTIEVFLRAKNVLRKI